MAHGQAFAAAPLWRLAALQVGLPYHLTGLSWDQEAACLPLRSPQALAAARSMYTPCNALLAMPMVTGPKGATPSKSKRRRLKGAPDAMHSPAAASGQQVVIMGQLSHSASAMSLHLLYCSLSSCSCDACIVCCLLPPGSACAGVAASYSVGGGKGEGSAAAAAADDEGSKGGALTAGDALMLQCFWLDQPAAFACGHLF